MVSLQAFPTLPPRAPLAFLSRQKLPFPSLSNACHAGYYNVYLICYWFCNGIFRRPQADVKASFWSEKSTSIRVVTSFLVRS